MTFKQITFIFLNVLNALFVLLTYCANKNDTIDEIRVSYIQCRTHNKYCMNRFHHT